MNQEYFLGLIKKNTTNNEVINFFNDKLLKIDFNIKKHDFFKYSDIINACLIIMEYVYESNEKLANEGMMTYDGGMEIIFSLTLDTLIFHTLEANIENEKDRFALLEIMNKYTMKYTLNEKYEPAEIYDELNKVLS